MLDFSDQISPPSQERVEAALDAAYAALPCPGAWFRHYKGGIYEVTGNGILEATMEPVLVYRSVDPAEQHKTWVRSASAFFSSVRAGGAARFQALRAAPDLPAVPQGMACHATYTALVQELFSAYAHPWRVYHGSRVLAEQLRAAQDAQVTWTPERYLAFLFSGLEHIPGAGKDIQKSRTQYVLHAMRMRWPAAVDNWAEVSELTDEVLSEKPQSEAGVLLRAVKLLPLADDALHFCVWEELLWYENRHLLSSDNPRKDFDTRRLRYLLAQAEQGTLYPAGWEAKEEAARTNLEGLRQAWVQKYRPQAKS